jgi:hypothetical protein
MFRRSGYRFADKNMRHSITARVQFAALPAPFGAPRSAGAEGAIGVLVSQQVACPNGVALMPTYSRR